MASRPPVPRVRVATLAPQLGITPEQVLAISRRHRMGVAAADSLLDPRGMCRHKGGVEPAKDKAPAPPGGRSKCGDECPGQQAKPARPGGRAKSGDECPGQQAKPAPQAAGQSAVTSARANKPSPLAVWQRLYKSYKRGETVSGWVTESVKGGLLVDVGIQAFLPGSEAGVPNVSHLDDLVGTKVTARIIEWGNQRSTSVILSRRGVVEEELRERAEQLLRDLKPGQVRSATVTSVGIDGVSVDLGAWLRSLGQTRFPPTSADRRPSAGARKSRSPCATFEPRRWLPRYARHLSRCLRQTSSALWKRWPQLAYTA